MPVLSSGTNPKCHLECRIYTCDPCLKETCGQVVVCGKIYCDGGEINLSN